MKKKTYMILAAICAGGIIAASLLLFRGMHMKSTEKRTDRADERIRTMLDDAAYKNGCAEERKERAAEVLNALQKEHCIYALDFSEENQMYSFRFADGALGGITLQDFQQDTGSLPMNGR